MPALRCSRSLLAALLMFVAPLARSELLPRWELGLGVGGLVMPDYRGSDESRAYLLPFPYFVYRLDWLKADRSGVRATLFDTEQVELNVSLSASPPVRSHSNAARAGMPDLKPLFEVGPSLDLNLWRGQDGGARLDLRLPLRAAFTLEAKPQSVGLIFTPRLNLDLLGPGRMGAKDAWRLGLLAGPIFSDRRQHAYYYGVDERYARSDRPAYVARGGYSGMQFLASVSRRINDVWLGAYVRWDSLSGAAFEDSPLVKRNSYASAGFAVSWTLGRSAVLVESPD